MPSYNDAAKPRTQFSIIHRSLLQSDELPLQSLVFDQRIAQIFQEEQISFGQEDDAVCTPAITLWGLLSQVFFKEEQRSCLAAVIRIAALGLALGRTVITTGGGDDEVTIGNSSFMNKFSVKTGDGDDIVKVDGSFGGFNTFANIVVYDGGKHVVGDTLTNAASNSYIAGQPLVKRFAP